MTAERRLSAVAVVCASTCAVFAQEPRVLSSEILHLGDTRIESWPAGTPDPVGRSLELDFEAESNDVEHCLILRYHDVDDGWAIWLNGVMIGTLRRGKALRDEIHVLPAGALRDGVNELRVVPQGRHVDDILIGAARLVTRSLREHLDLRAVGVEVEGADGRRLPARVTVTDRAGELVDVYYAAGDRTATRKGILYLADGVGRFEIPPGDYRIWASRGMEWGVDRADLSVPADGRVTLTIVREVDTTGFVAADTHVHTYEFSGHGDASLRERLVTLAAEGVELAVATDHNHNVDYRPMQRSMGLSEHYTSIVGNEVTTDNGHFNAFPLDPNDRVPNHEIADWVRLIDGMRARGAKVVILNHPRWPQIHTGPFGKQHFHLNRLTGAFENGPAEVTWDAMELVNATTRARDPLYNFVDWFALLNHGERVMAVGSSDSHTVADPVGQGRTYLRSSTDDPASVDIDEACTSIRDGSGSVAQGIFVEVRVGDGHRMGEVATLPGDRFRTVLRVASAAWVRPRTAWVYLNGKRVAEQSVPVLEGEPVDVTLSFELDVPPNDAHLVCIVVGDGVHARHWRTDATNDYTLGATNPVWLDVDGDGAYTDPKSTAARTVERVGLRADALASALTKVDDAVAVQALGIVHARLAAEPDTAHAVLLEVARRLDRADVIQFVELVRH